MEDRWMLLDKVVVVRGAMTSALCFPPTRGPARGSKAELNASSTLHFSPIADRGLKLSVMRRKTCPTMALQVMENLSHNDMVQIVFFAKTNKLLLDHCTASAAGRPLASSKNFVLYSAFANIAEITATCKNL